MDFQTVVRPYRCISIRTNRRVSSPAPGPSAKSAPSFPRWAAARTCPDATRVAAPKQRNTKAERTTIKAGQIAEGWAKRPAKLRQKDRDARWTVKVWEANPYRLAGDIRGIGFRTADLVAQTVTRIQVGQGPR